MGFDDKESIYKSIDKNSPPVGRYNISIKEKIG